MLRNYVTTTRHEPRSPATLTATKPTRHTFDPGIRSDQKPALQCSVDRTHQIRGTRCFLDQRIHLIRHAHLAISRIAHGPLELPPDRIKRLGRDLAEIDMGALALAARSVLAAMQPFSESEPQG